MKNLIICLILVSVSADYVPSGLPQSENGRVFEQELRNLLEKFRETVFNGDPDKGIPVLDPYYTNQTLVNVTIPDTALILIDFHELTIPGLGAFVVDKIGFSVLSLRLDFGFTIPKINISAGNYVLDGYVIEKPLFGNGSSEMAASLIEIAGFAKLTIRNGSLFMNDFYITVDIDEFMSNAQGLLDGEDQCVFLNQMLQNIVPGLVVSQREQLSELIGKYVMDYANQFLPDLTLEDLIDLITGGNNTNPMYSEDLNNNYYDVKLNLF